MPTTTQGISQCASEKATDKIIRRADFIRAATEGKKKNFDKIVNKHCENVNKQIQDHLNNSDYYNPVQFELTSSQFSDEDARACGFKNGNELMNKVHSELSYYLLKAGYAILSTRTEDTISVIIN